jgi:hypothetical protein
VADNAHIMSTITRRVLSVGHGAKCVARIAMVAGWVTAFTERYRTSPVERLPNVSLIANPAAARISLNRSQLEGRPMRARRRRRRNSLQGKKIATAKKAMTPEVSLRR